MRPEGIIAASSLEIFSKKKYILSGHLNLLTAVKAAASILLDRTETSRSMSSSGLLHTDVPIFSEDTSQRCFRPFETSPSSHFPSLSRSNFFL